MLDDNLRTQLQSYLGRMTRPIVLVATLDGSDASRELLGLLEDVASLSTLITLEKRAADGAIRSPSFSVGRVGEGPGIRFAGLPMGHEFTSLVLALLHSGGHPPKVDAAVIEQVAALGGEFEFETYISLSCRNCPDVVQALNLMAVLNPRIRSTMIDGALFQAEVEARGIMAVPSVYLNGQPFGQGRMTVEEIIAKLDKSSDARRAALENHVKTYDVDIMNLQRASSLLPADQDGRVGVQLASGVTLRSRSVILATGARWREMNVPGEREYRGKGVAYCPHCDGPLFKGKRVAVIGGGNSGVEAAIDLAGLVAHVTLIEFDGVLRADEVLQRKLRSLPNVRVIVSAQTTGVHGDAGKVNALSYRDRSSGDLHRVDLEGVFVQIGLLPNTEWLKGTVGLSQRGEIEVDARGAFDHLIRSSAPAEDRTDKAA